MKDFKLEGEKKRLRGERKHMQTEPRVAPSKGGKMQDGAVKSRTSRNQHVPSRRGRRALWYTEELTQLLRLQASFSLQSGFSFWHSKLSNKYLNTPLRLACWKNSDALLIWVLGTSWNLSKSQAARKQKTTWLELLPSGYPSRRKFWRLFTTHCSPPLMDFLPQARASSQSWIAATQPHGSGHL